jgi:thiamine kinase
MKSRRVRFVEAEQALSAIPHFHLAEVESRLSDGPTNASYLVNNAGRSFVLRLDKPGASELGLNRANEQLIIQSVARAGLAPEPVYSDLRAGVCLRRFIEGRSWSKTDLARPANLRRLASRLRALHRLPPAGELFDPLAAARRYQARLGTAESLAILQRAERQMAEISAREPSRVLCHNDLVCRNIVEGGPLMLIDWEYAAVGDPYFDLAVVVQHHELGARSAEQFLRAYLQQSFATDAISHLRMQCRFYQSLLQLWLLRVQTEY